MGVDDVNLLAVPMVPDAAQLNIHNSFQKCTTVFTIMFLGYFNSLTSLFIKKLGLIDIFRSSRISGLTQVQPDSGTKLARCENMDMHQGWHDRFVRICREKLGISIERYLQFSVCLGRR